jgi:guanylate kinase
MKRGEGLMKKGNLFILSGPSGVGKGTILEELFKIFDDIRYSISVTTRKPREGEVNGKDYFFISEKKFFQMRDNNEFIEWAKVHNNYYATPKKFVNDTINSGKDIILEIDIQGAKQLKENYPELIYIFLIPPSFNELKNRLEHRNTEDKKNKVIRLNNAIQEMKEIKEYNYLIVNDTINETVEKLRAIIIAESCRIKNQI